MRYGIKAIIGESYSEIFLGNSSVLGLPCFTADKVSIDALQTLLERAPETMVDARVDTGAITAGTLTIQGHMPVGMRDAFVTDKWNPTSMLLAQFEDVRGVAGNLPYVAGF